MKQRITHLIDQALQQLVAQEKLPPLDSLQIRVDAARDSAHGDYASNIALSLAKQAQRSPRELAELICAALPASSEIDKVEIAGPGFINFFVSAGSTNAIVQQVLVQQQNFGRSTVGAGHKVQVEFVSANPTGPLHVGHGRGAAYGDTVAALLEAVGYTVEREYYVNDAGRQMDILAASVWLRYLQNCGEELTFPSNAYQGDYIRAIAEQLVAEHGEQLRVGAADVFSGVSADATQGGDKEKHIDGLIASAKAHLRERYELVFSAALSGILDDIRADLQEFGVTYDTWFSERSLSEQPSQIDKAIEQLHAHGVVEQENGALWFRSTRFGDDKDRVVLRDNGESTYFASDIAYVLNKYERGYDKVIYVWGADHHGYIDRVYAAIKALGLDPEKASIKLVQFVHLYRGERQMQMSTRSGEFVTLRELREEVGTDATRFFYLMRRCEQTTDFDLDLAKSQSKDNPVYYVQYAHARVCSVFKKLEQAGKQWDSERGLNNLDSLTEEHEQNLMRKLTAYPETLNKAARNYEPHLLTTYLRDLAADFHTYYNAHKMLIDDANLRDARLCLSAAVRQVIANGLRLLGVSAPESM
ncbi:MAG: arginine--tRNA ligase [Pseudomonadales bacterium]